MSVSRRVVFRRGFYAVVEFSRPAVGIRDFSRYWREHGAIDFQLLAKGIRTFAEAKSFIPFAEEAVRQIQPNADHQWNASHEAIIFLENQGFSMTQRGGWSLPKPGYQLDLKEKSALEYLIKEHKFFGVEQK